MDGFKSALIIGSSGGIGSTLADHLDQPGCKVTTLSRREEGLDVTNETSVEIFAKGLDGSFDLIFVATGGLELGGHRPEKSIQAMSVEAMQTQFNVNAIGPALCLKHFSPLLAKDRQSVFAVLTAKIGSIEDNRLGGWISYRAAKAAANQIVKTASIELQRKNATSICVAVHPGTVHTAMTEKYVANHKAEAPKKAAMKIINVLNGLTPKDTGSFVAYDGSRLPW